MQSSDPVNQAARAIVPTSLRIVSSHSEKWLSVYTPQSYIKAGFDYKFEMGYYISCCLGYL